MRLGLIILVIVTLSACTIGNSHTPPVSSNMVQSKISKDKYSPSLQKTVPSPTYGTGKHNVIIYADFQCPACINFSNTVGKIFESYADAGKITITYKQFPLTSIHKNAYRDAIAALCGAETGNYKEAKDAIYALEAQKKGSTITDIERVAVLVEAGQDREMMTQCLADNRFAAQVDAEVAEGNAARVNGTPTVLLNGARLDLGVVFADVEKGKAFLDRVFAQ